MLSAPKPMERLGSVVQQASKSCSIAIERDILGGQFAGDYGHLKFNSSPLKSYLPKRKVVFQPGAVWNFGGVHCRKLRATQPLEKTLAYIWWLEHDFFEVIKNSFFLFGCCNINLCPQSSLFLFQAIVNITQLWPQKTQIISENVMPPRTLFFWNRFFLIFGSCKPQWFIGNWAPDDFLHIPSWKTRGNTTWNIMNIGDHHESETWNPNSCHQGHIRDARGCGWRKSQYRIFALQYLLNQSLDLL